jgi:SAM-dependent methyltransferase
MPEYSCGCVNEADAATGALRSVSKCEWHRARMREPRSLDGSYYAELKILEGRHVQELTEAVGPFPAATGDRQALEIGCGVSPYAGAIREAGWHYQGLDASPWAARWTARHWGVSVAVSSWEDWIPPHPFGLILAAHVLEHLPDAPAGLLKMRRALAPGGELRIVIPDDEDPTNPDHLYFFNPMSLVRACDRAGLAVERLEVRRIVAHENFIYASVRRHR